MNGDGTEERLGMAENGRKRSSGQPNRATATRQVFDEHVLDDRILDKHEADDDREDLEDERLSLFLDTQHQTVLPTLPRQDGYHVCWLTTTNSRDTSHWRRSIGYELITLSDHPEWSGIATHSGEYAGFVCVGEMVAARITISQYNKYMRAMHHDLPLAEEEKLRGQTELMRQSAEQAGVRVTEIGNGTAKVVQRAKPMPVLQF